MRRKLESEAVEALRETLGRVSVIKIKSIGFDQNARRDGTILGHIEIYGHAHLLACKVVGMSDEPCLRRAVCDLGQISRERGVVVMPVLIVPSGKSNRAEAICRESHTGFVDLEGNARIYFEEVFIVKRSLPNRQGLPPQAEPLPTSETAHFAEVA